jgi:hypothetical protein
VGTTNDEVQDVRDLFDFDNIATEASSEFWTAYLFAGYQPRIGEDEDPETEGADTTVGVTDALNGQGSIVFWETLAVQECQVTLFPPPPHFCDGPSTSAHEIAHLLNALDGEGGLMSNLSRTVSPISLRKIREVMHP